MPQDPAMVPSQPGRPSWGAVTVGALGVVFGDIGTSPIYTIQTIFNPEDPHPVTATEESVYGLLSLVFWSVTVIVTLLYVGLVLRADNHGEGGILSLITLLPGQRSNAATTFRRRVPLILATLGVFGASLFLADSMITPAISVLSAVEGLRVVNPALEPLVIPLTVVIILVLFTAHRHVGVDRRRRRVLQPPPRSHRDHRVADLAVVPPCRHYLDICDGPLHFPSPGHPAPVTEMPSGTADRGLR